MACLITENHLSKKGDIGLLLAIFLGLNIYMTVTFHCAYVTTGSLELD